MGGRGIEGGGESGGPKSADLFNRDLVGDEFGEGEREPEGIPRIAVPADTGASLGKEWMLDRFGGSLVDSSSSCESCLDLIDKPISP